jgi:ABC-type multidrug transport system fused ATPase/permease subunit
MFERHQQIQKWFNDIIEKFRQKGAVSPDKAMTVEELGLPPRFQEAMKRRLGRLGVFVEVNGKYYLSEERLKQVEEMRATRGTTWNPRKRIMTLRIVQMVTVILFVALFLANIFIQNWELKIVSVAFLIVWLLISIILVFYMTRARKRFSASNTTHSSVTL